MNMVSGAPTALTWPPAHSASQPGDDKRRDGDVDGLFASMLSFGSNTSAKLHTQTMADAEQMFQAKGADRSSEQNNTPAVLVNEQEQSEALTEWSAKGELQPEQGRLSEDSMKDFGPTFGNGPAPRDKAPRSPMASSQALEAVQAAPWPAEIRSPRQTATASGALTQSIAATSLSAQNSPAILFSSTVGTSPSPALQVADLLKGNANVEMGRTGEIPGAANNSRAPRSEVAGSSKPKEPQPRSGTGNLREQLSEIKASKFDELVKSLRVQMGAKQSSARLRLQPPELGHLRVDVRVLGDRVRIDVQAETNAARDVLSRRAEQLKTGLEKQGIRLERLEVVLNSTTTNIAGGSAALQELAPMPLQLNEFQRPRESRRDESRLPARQRTSRLGTLAATGRIDING